MPTGDAEFDAAFRVAGLIAMGESPFASAEVRQRIAAHNDWIFSFDGPLLACVGRPDFKTPDELTTRVHEAIGVVTAFPESVAPSKVDHSVDDLLVRIGELDSVEDGSVSSRRSRRTTATAWRALRLPWRASPT